ncbi:MAG: PSD1 domain-containing protein [Planctomycetaceae bacterium]|nr:PSD1 domain-containing protein [Planctomycetales bacterium]MCB9922841.1 PSD1 domain-containing protein [Planctomycetaceae bacterium]
MSRFSVTIIVLVPLFATHPAAGQVEVNFQRDVRPILSDKCFFCHGPDEAHREADLRLDVAEMALAAAIVPGKPDESELIARVSSTDPDTQMPPPDSGKSLTKDEIELLKSWVVQGAPYQVHWAFIPPVRPSVPQITSGRIRNAIDAFVTERLNRESLSMAAEADRVTWLRRLSLDLIGLPPTIEEVDAFLSDDSDDAYEKQIRRLLESPHYGERWARIWLDAARYADSNGYEKDAPREMWFYRDWVIDALNDDLPYDQFVIQQIAGDLIAKTFEQRANAEPHGVDPQDVKQGRDAATLAVQNLRVATGFLRNSMINEEGGADPEQFRMEAMYDRMDAIGKGVLGLTIQCAQCHSHKYDPLTQEDYYRMFAFLNNTHDAIIPVYTPEEQQHRETILAKIADVENNLKVATPDWQQRLAAWEEKARQSVIEWEVLKPVNLPYEGQKFRVLDDFSILSESYAPKSSAPEFDAHTEAEGITGFRLELLTHPKLPRGGPGRSVRGTAALTQFNVYVAPLDNPSKRTKLKLVSATADVNPADAPQPEYLRNIDAKDGDQRTTGPIQFAIDDNANTAWTTDIDPGRRNQPRKAVFVPESPVGFPQGTIITFQPTMNHGGWNNNDNHNCLMGRYRFSLSTSDQPVADPLPAHVREILDVEPAKRTALQQAAVFSFWRSTVEEWADANAQIESLWQSYPEGTTQHVLQERDQMRQTSLLSRGDFLKPVRPVERGVPGFLHSLPDDGGASRLTFARWLTDERSPTTARSIVNRIWQAYFGVGLVETSDDLGSQGTPPSHPELLDWLAVELVENNWSLKHLHHLIASSTTYRQSSVITPSLYQQDPYNRLLARGPRFRVDAEIVRDITLAASGLLNPQVGGPSVYPPAPRFLFDPPASYGPKTWNEELGDNRYRRGLYTFRFRSVPYPMLETFDSVIGNVSCVRRNRSNTPLQALTSLNEPIFMECARSLAAKTLQHGGDTDESRIAYAVRRCVARSPQQEEISTLKLLLDKQRKRIAAGDLDTEVIVQIDDAASESEDERAAWTLLARVLLNLDETITKE